MARLTSYWVRTALSTSGIVSSSRFHLTSCANTFSGSAFGARNAYWIPSAARVPQIVECKKLGIPSTGIEVNPLAHFAAQVKTDWTPDPDGLVNHASEIAASATQEFESQGLEDDSLPLFQRWPARRSQLRSLGPEKLKLLLANSISPVPLHKTLILLDCLNRNHDERYGRHELLALARALVSSVGNLHFGPEVGVRAPKHDAPVVTAWLAAVRGMARDLVLLPRTREAPVVVHCTDSRQILDVLQPSSIDGVITSPPYPNEKDYTRTTRLEAVLLGFVRDKQDLQALKRKLVRSNTRSIYKGDDDDKYVIDHPEIQRIAKAIEGRRVELGKTSGFERMYHRVTTLYFGGMARHLAGLRYALRPGARLAYVVGDQASYLRVPIRTGQLLAEIAESLGYAVAGIDLFRTRLATATKDQLREEVVVLHWPGRPPVETKSCDKDAGS